MQLLTIPLILYDSICGYFKSVYTSHMSQVFGTYVKLAGNIIFILPFSGSRLSKEKYKYNYVLDPSLGIFQEL